VRQNRPTKNRKKGAQRLDSAEPAPIYDDSDAASRLQGLPRFGSRAMGNVRIKAPYLSGSENRSPRAVRVVRAESPRGKGRQADRKKMNGC
jgi:hypothetical protein